MQKPPAGESRGRLPSRVRGYCFFSVVSVEEDEEPAELLLGEALLGELELPPLAGLLEDFSSVVELGEELEDDELGLLGVLGVLIELEDEGEVLLVPAEDEPDGEDGSVLEEEPVAERLVSEREAPVLDPGPLSQP